MLTLRVTNANEHLGHPTAEGNSNVHPVWCDGCRGRLVGTDEEFVIWWNSGENQDAPHRFENGQTYEVQYEGELQSGVMGFQGKCLHIRQLKSVKPNGS